MLIWLEDAPVYGCDSDDDITSFIDQIITCEKPVNDPELGLLVNRQIHRHSHTCCKKSKMECRFNYPLPPMKSTSILYPISSDVSESDFRKHKENWKNVSKNLNDMIEGDDVTFEQMLINLDITEQNYYLAIRSNPNSPTIFLKRNPNELRVNNYNSACLNAWRANMDIQFVLDVYACAMYIVSYISKAQKGMSQILQQACEEAKKGNCSIKQQVRDIGNKFLNSVEISPQEAVYIVLQLPIYSTGIIKRYIERPTSMENVTLADWAALYDSPKNSFRKKSKSLDTDNRLLETGKDDDNEDEFADFIEEGKNNAKIAKPKQRLKLRIIRSV